MEPCMNRERGNEILECSHDGPNVPKLEAT